MFRLYVWPGVGLVVCEHSWYTTTWQSALTEGLRVPTRSRTNTDSVLYLFLTCTRPPDSTRNKYTDDVAYTQERLKSKSQNTCNQLVIVSSMYFTFTAQFWSECNIKDVILSSTLNHFVRSTSTGVISSNSSTGAMVLSWTPITTLIYINKTTSSS